MMMKLAAGASVLTLACSAVAVFGDAPAQSRLRPPAVPLVACDPYFSVWSTTDELTAGPTRHWTGKPQRLTSLVRVDGKPFRLMGDQPADVPAARQVGLTVTPTRSIYAFDAAGVRLTLTFMTPLLPDDLMVCSRPITYVTWSATAAEGSHDVAVYLDAAAELATNTPDQQVAEQRGTVGGLTTLRVGTTAQPILETRGDDRRIDWGYFYLAGDTKGAALLAPNAARTAFAKGNALPTGAPGAPAQAETAPALAMTFDLGKAGTEAKGAHAILAYDDVASIRYFNSDLVGYWRKDGATIEQLLGTAEKDYASLADRCANFDDELIADLHKIGGDAYVQVGVLAWRQALAAQKICVDANGQPLMFSKENFSNGCIGTVDVLYPASPQMMAFSPTMLKASLTPLLDYSSSERWKHNSAPHDLGTYPLATGQVYGGGDSDSGMPVEETGNMLCMLAALAKAEGSADFSAKYWPTLTKWADYLKENGIDPGKQLTTDDFAGHIARNTNLSAKAIMGIASYAMLADQLGKKDVAESYRAFAKASVQKWMQMADEGDHYGLVFGDAGKGTWSQKYNLVWDRLLGFDLFPAEVMRKELAFYRTKINPYGLPLDSRKDYTKLDWEIWTATLSGKDEDFRAIVDPIGKWVNETPARVPMTDWYDTETGKQSGFQARSVVGGVFIPFLRDEATWKKYASRDKTKVGGWAETDFAKPQVKVLVPAADTEPATWRYTTSTPAGRWQAAAYDDSSWKTGPGGFGTEGTPAARIGTVWNSPDIWLRRDFTLPEGVKDPMLYLHHDEDAEVFLNGVSAARPRGFVAEYVTVRIRDEAKATLKPGKNTIAIHCHQLTGGQYVDAGIVELVRKTDSSKPQ